jgi:hypothetical protein
MSSELHIFDFPAQFSQHTQALHVARARHNTCQRESYYIDAQIDVVADALVDDKGEL